MSKEAQRITSRAKEVDIFGDKVDVSNLKELTSCAAKVAVSCEGKVIILVAATPDNHLLVAAIVPVRVQNELSKKWLAKSVELALSGSDCARPSQEKTDNGSEIELIEIAYPANSERFALKIADEVLSNAFAFLKSTGVYKEPEEEKEYDFDDIE